MSDSLNPFVAIANSPEGQSGVSLTKSFKKTASLFCRIQPHQELLLNLQRGLLGVLGRRQLKGTLQHEGGRQQNSRILITKQLYYLVLR